VHLVLAIVGARAIYELRSASDPTRAFRGLKRVLARAFRGVAWLIFVPGVYLAVRASWFEMDKDVHSSWLGATLVVVGAVWVLFEAVTSPTALARVWFATALTLLQVGIVIERLPSGTIVPAWRFAEDPRNPHPFRTDVAYLAAYRWEDMVALMPAWRAEGYGLVGVSSDMRPGSLSLHAGVEFVNGYSPMHPKALGEVFGFELHGAAGEQNLHRVLSEDDPRYGILSWMAVDGLVVGSAFGDHLEDLATKGWRRASDLSAGVVLERTGPPTPRVRALASAEFVSREAWDSNTIKPVSSPRAVLVDDLGARNGVHEFANVEIGDWKRRRNEVSVTVSSAEPTKDALLLFSMPWLPGHRAFLDGEEVPVLRAFGFMPAVVLPAGRTGVVTVRYRPRGFEVGVLAAVIGLAAAIGWVGLPSLRKVRRRQPLTDSNDASRQFRVRCGS
jgi:hypothetical protein